MVAMEENTLEFIKWILAGALGTGWVGTFMFYRSKRKKVMVESEKEELQYDIAQIEHLKKQNKEAYETIEKLQEIINELRAKNVEDAMKINELELKLIAAEGKQKFAEYNTCVVDDCCNRMPKRETDLCKHETETRTVISETGLHNRETVH